MYYFFTFALPIVPFLSYLLIYLGVKITNIPTYFYHQSIINKARRKLTDSRTEFIGITGSYGKSSVKEYLYELISTQYETSKNDNNNITEFGIAQSILKYLRKDTRYFITEFCSCTKGEIKKATSYIPLQYAILTGLGNKHLDLYGNKKELIDEETYFLYKIPKKGKVYINYDVPIRKEIARNITAERIYYGTHKNADIVADIYESTHEGQKAGITYKDTTFEIQTQLLGEHSIVNLLPAIGLALDIRISSKKITKCISNLKPTPGRLSIHKGKNGYKILNNCENSTVEGFISAIQTLNKFPQKSKMIISQGIIELGVEKRESYKKIIKEIYKTNIRLITTDSVFQEEDIAEKVKTLNDVKSVKKYLSSKIDKNTIILIDGSFPKDLIDFLMN